MHFIYIHVANTNISFNPLLNEETNIIWPYY